MSQFTSSVASFNAVQYTSASLADVTALIAPLSYVVQPDAIKINLIAEAPILVHFGDWLLKDSKGTLLSITNTQFQASYSPPPILMQWQRHDVPNFLNWLSVCWSPSLKLFCAVASGGVGNGVMTSPDGITWTTQVPASDASWNGVCWSPELALFCAVSNDGSLTGAMTSPDGINWTSQSTPAGSAGAVCWSPALGLFCMAGYNITTSPDGVTWTQRTSPAALNTVVCWSPEKAKFCTVGVTGAGAINLTSTDGIVWTAHTSLPDSAWTGLCWSPQLLKFCAVSQLVGTFTYNVALSDDGEVWQPYITPVGELYGVTWGHGPDAFCALSTDGKARMSSNGKIWNITDAISPSSTTSAQAVCFSPELGLFCTVGYGHDATDCAASGRVVTGAVNVMPA